MPDSRFQVRDVDKGYKALIERIRANGKPLSLTVGVHSDDGSAAEPGGLTVLEVATIQEFGNGHVPERSFIRAWADENEAKNKATLAAIGNALVRGQIKDVKTGLDRAGLRFVAEIQGRIVAGIAPENAPSTVARKGSSTPLINKGQLKSSIRHKVGSGNE